MKTFSLEAYLDDLKKLCAIDSGHHNAEGTNAMAAAFKARFDALGLNTEIRHYNDNDFAPVVIATNGDAEQYDAMFIAHMDTVFPVGDGAKRPLTVGENRIATAPGIVDCKGGCLMIEYLLRELKARGDWGFKFAVALNSDEETKSVYSRAYFEELAAKSKYCFVFEPGRPNDEFVAQRKGGSNYIVRVHGIAAHSGVEPEKGASAILELAKWIPEIDKLVNYETGTVINIGKMSGGGDNGQVPDYAECSVSCRCLNPDDGKALEDLFEKMKAQRFDMRTTIEVETTASRPPMVMHAASEKLLGELNAVGEEMGVKVEALTTGGMSDGNFVSHFGVGTLDGCGPCGGKLHTVDEYLKMDSVEPRMEMMLKLFDRLFAAK